MLHIIIYYFNENCRLIIVGQYLRSSVHVNSTVRCALYITFLFRIVYNNVLLAALFAFYSPIVFVYFILSLQTIHLYVQYQYCTLHIRRGPGRHLPAYKIYNTYYVIALDHDDDAVVCDRCSYSLNIQLRIISCIETKNKIVLLFIIHITLRHILYSYSIMARVCIYCTSFVQL